jgi:myo-inositol 2-dehydrogenase/D-chiro-inositol 1-dehydrogenase
MGDVLKIGVVGVGAIGRTHIDRINNKLTGGRVVGCSRIMPRTLPKKIADQFGIKAYESGEAMISDPEIDAVVVTTSDPFHEQYVTEAIKAGKHVFCEKPLSPTPEACKRIVDAEMASGRHLVQVGFMRRYDPGYAQLKKMIDSRKYGAPLVLHCCHRNYDDGGVGWKTSMSVENSMIHEIDVLRWLIGENYVKTDVVFPRSSKHAGDAKDPQIMHLITESGIYIEVESFVFSHYGYDVRCEVVCEEGTLNLPEPPYAMVRCKRCTRHTDLSTTGPSASRKRTTSNSRTGSTRRKKTASTARPPGTDTSRRSRPDAHRKHATLRPRSRSRSRRCRSFTVNRK